MKHQATVSVGNRAKAGQGKMPWGITETMTKRILAIRADSASGLKSHAANLYQFTAQYIAHARDLARSDQKDAARDWYRYFENSQVLSVLESFSGCGDLARLRLELKQLGLECHPLDVPGWQTDIQAIRHCLTEILTYVTQKPSTNKTVRRFNPCRFVNRHYGNDEHRP